MKKKITIGILAHVDAGKTTLSEALLYTSGKIRTLGRVDHRNTYLDSPKFLDPDYSMRDNKNIFFAGQMTGVEGYVESASSGFVAGINAAMLALGRDAVVFPKETEIGALAHYVSEGGISSSFQPMNANFGIIAPFDKKIKGGKKARNEAYSVRSLDIIKGYNIFKNN